MEMMSRVRQDWANSPLPDVISSVPQQLKSVIKTKGDVRQWGTCNFYEMCSHQNLHLFIFTKYNEVLSVKTLEIFSLYFVS